ncbi:MAG: nicotinate phosphoribosyltransferase [Actinobacteria bacterium]|nr:nicotinate phosphoribosyltransferase [Actinomycetota bacterium]
MTPAYAGSTATLTDRYELTMLDAARESGVADRRAVFELFGRRLPEGRRFGVVAGVDRVAEAVAAFRFGPDELAWLEANRMVRPATLAWLAGFRFEGDVRGYRDGEIYMPGSPLLTVEGTFAEAVILETLLLSIVNHDAAIAGAAARMVRAANGKPLIEMGGRRTHELAAVSAARAAYVAGFTATSNLEAGRRYGVPTAGTAAHAFTLAHASERDAFRAQLATLGIGTTLLVDTYDVAEGIRNAVAAASEMGARGPGAIRLDSGDPLTEARRARSLLDGLGAVETRIIVTGDLDEHRIARLERAGAPVDGYGVGTQLVTGAGHPTAELVYKLVAIADRPGAGAPLHPVAKLSEGKQTTGGAKTAFRLLDEHGVARAERAVVDGEGVDAPGCWTVRPLQAPVLEGGVPVADGGPLQQTQAARAHHAGAIAELPLDARELGPGPPAFCAAPVDPRGEEVVT